MSSVIDMHLAKAIADMAIFLEFTNADLLDEDAAVEAMEQLAAELRLMDASSLRSLSEQFRSLAAKYEAERSRFIENLPESLGLV